MLVYFVKGVAAVVVVGVDDSERLFYNVFAAVDRVPRAEGLVFASYTVKPRMALPSSVIGSACLSPPKRLPMPAAITTSVVF